MPGEASLHDGKHLPNGARSLGVPLRRIFLASKAQTRLGSLRKMPTHA